jgi:MFS family permease
MQILIVSRLSKRLGPKNIFFIVPGALAAGMACAAAVYAFISVVVVRFAANVLATTFERPARKAVQGLAPEGKRGRVTTFIDSFLFAIAQIVGCALLGGGILLRRTGVLSETTVAVGYLAVGAMCALLAVYFVMRLRATYDSSLMNWRLARRKRAAVITDIDF